MACRHRAALHFHKDRPPHSDDDEARPTTTEVIIQDGERLLLVSDLARPDVSSVCLSEHATMAWVAPPTPMLPSGLAPFAQSLWIVEARTIKVCMNARRALP